MNTNTDPVRALLTKWRSESTSDDQSSDYECGEHDARSECADELESALAQQSAGVDEAMVERAVAAVMSAPTGISVEAYVRIVLEAALAQQPAGVDEADTLLRDLVEALDAAFISSWQSTAAWQKQLDAAREYLAAQQQGGA